MDKEIKFSSEDIDYAQKETWDLIQSGKTCGVFQCESRLVRGWLRKIKPQNLWELSAVVAIVRPGALKSGFAEEYVEYKDGVKEFVSFGHPIIDSVFESTHHVMLYQEQLMKLGARLAWCDLDERARLVKVDALRKGVGKKNQQKLLEIGNDFVAGAIKNGLDKDLAENLFEIIKNCGRYLFNLSHSFQYAKVAYKTAYLKTNFPLQFYATYLSYAKFRAQGYREFMTEMIQEGRVLGIKFLSPNFNNKNLNFCIEGEAIRYGLDDIKHFGGTIAEKIKDLPEIKTYQDFIRLNFSKHFGLEINVTIGKNLIQTGCFSDIGLSRSGLMSLYELFESFSPKEYDNIMIGIDSVPLSELKNHISNIIETKFMKSRKEKGRSVLKFFDYEKPDDLAGIEVAETTNMGICLSGSSVDTKGDSNADTCYDCSFDGYPPKTIKSINVVLDLVEIIVTRSGKSPGSKMARLKVHDATGSIEALPVFPDLYKLTSQLLIPNNTVNISLLMGKQGWIAQEITQI